LFDAKLPVQFWGEAMQVACYLRNRSPAAGKSKTPHGMFSGKKPDVSHLKSVWAKVPDQQRKKLNPKAVKGIFVGYAFG
jgi:hypothetical protein